MTKFRIGRHINISYGFVTAPWYAHSLGCNIFQIFLGSPQNVLSKARKKDELDKFGKELKKYKIKMVIHASYTINFCHPTKSKRFETSVKSLVQDLRASANIGKGCLGVIIHMGKNVPENKLSYKQALENYVIGLKHALSATPENTHIILETGAGQGYEVGSKISDLSEIYWKLAEDERARIKFCIDTCHIWATGYDISTANGVRKFFKEFDDSIGIDKIVCIHMNDSKTKLNSNVDRHADLGFGYIGIEGLKAVAKFAQKHKINLIMETPLDSVNPKTNKDVTFAEEFAKLKSWINSKINSKMA
ncbi:MAG: putative endonuclease 4 [Satyrvirus sp.]|uniref:Putative endonuclease 4 n=1 Tax=Satyrvirus sp. TaxID=2487771 RepID=A0A3G5AD25_9VIRU|nr:MAG: putative endonuclease 4 [Satyrvirus sp.]